MPAAPGNQNELSTERALSAHAAFAARALKSGGVTHLRSLRGGFRQWVTISLRWRQRWIGMDLPQRRRYAATGYCPWISGGNRVYAWVPESLAGNPDYTELALLADMGGLSYPAIDAIIRCCQSAEDRGGRPPPPRPTRRRAQ